MTIQVEFALPLPVTLPILKIVDALIKREDYIFDMCQDNAPVYWRDQLANVNYLIGAFRHCNNVVLLNSALCDTMHDVLRQYGNKTLTADWLKLVRLSKSAKRKSRS